MNDTDGPDLIDADALQRCVSDIVGPYRRMSARLLAGGASNLTFLLDLDDRRYVLRRRPPGRTAPKAHDMRREFTMLSALQATGVPVPHVLLFHEEDDVVGAPFYLMDYVPGLVVNGPEDAAALTADHARTASLELIETLVGLHRVDVEAVGLERFGHPAGFVERRIRGWMSQWAETPGRDLPEVDELGSQLLERVPSRADATLVHGDYRIGNVIIDPGDPVRIVSIVDWELSTLGDPLTDLAHLIAYWESWTGRISHPAQLIAQRPGFLSGSELVGRYADLTGRDVSALPFYVAFEHWRAAVIKEATYQRGLDRGDHDDPIVAFTGEAVRIHLAEAADILAGRAALGEG